MVDTTLSVFFFIIIQTHSAEARWRNCHYWCLCNCVCIIHLITAFFLSSALSPSVLVLRRLTLSLFFSSPLSLSLIYNNKCMTANNPHSCHILTATHLPYLPPILRLDPVLPWAPPVLGYEGHLLTSHVLQSRG